ncbi:Organic solute transporter subunit alpha/Transmembrane protein 184 [Dillenia turbinata]|uniref:Organic solute transporter subunit alpha/Transmembrane protein 184 n=1 Tax=Dillenia turbinata TaxID=194707 RepID=A0AAN8U8S8_9MAGN
MVEIYYIAIALPCTVAAIALAIFHIHRHLLNYTEPTYQRFIVRIIFMVPVYALMSFLALILPDSAIYFNSIREVYEAWVIYNFLSLCLAWVGGPGAVVLSLSGHSLKPSWCLMTCCFPPMSLDGRFIRRCKQGCLQFVILKPILVAVTFILYAKGKYEDGNFSANQSFLYLTIIYTVSYSMALYALALFYVACRDLLQPFNPIPKFIIIKSVVFLTYWQGVLVFLAAKSGFIKDAKKAAEFQNFIICVEMLIAAVGHFFAFPYKEYAGANIGGCHDFTANLAHALKLNDFYHDTVHQFAPAYHEYTLYNNAEGDESRTFVPTGQEMDAVRKNKHMYGNKIENIQLSSVPPSGASTPNNGGSAYDSSKNKAMQYSLLVDTSNPASAPYDMSLIDMELSNYPASVPAVNVTVER